MGMLDATERTRPIMEYVHTLETRVRRYQNQQRRFQAKFFIWGMLAGAALVAAAWALR